MLHTLLCVTCGSDLTSFLVFLPQLTFFEERLHDHSNTLRPRILWRSWVRQDWNGNNEGLSNTFLEMLDAQQNRSFMGHDLHLTFAALYDCTADTLDAIPAPFFDGMTVLEVSAYFSGEKGQKYSCPQVPMSMSLPELATILSTEMLVSVAYGTSSTLKRTVNNVDEEKLHEAEEVKELRAHRYSTPRLVLEEAFRIRVGKAPLGLLPAIFQVADTDSVSIIVSASTSMLTVPINKDWELDDKNLLCASAVAESGHIRSNEVRAPVNIGSNERVGSLKVCGEEWCLCKWGLTHQGTAENAGAGDGIRRYLGGACPVYLRSVSSAASQLHSGMTEPYKVSGQSSTIDDPEFINSKTLSAFEYLLVLCSSPDLTISPGSRGTSKPPGENLSITQASSYEKVGGNRASALGADYNIVNGPTNLCGQREAHPVEEASDHGNASLAKVTHLASVRLLWTTNASERVGVRGESGELQSAFLFVAPHSIQSMITKSTERCWYSAIVLETLAIKEFLRKSLVNLKKELFCGFQDVKPRENYVMDQRRNIEKGILGWRVKRRNSSSNSEPVQKEELPRKARLVSGLFYPPSLSYSALNSDLTRMLTSLGPHSTIGRGHNGDPASTLLKALDPKLNISLAPAIPTSAIELGRGAKKDTDVVAVSRDGPVSRSSPSTTQSYIAPNLGAAVDGQVVPDTCNLLDFPRPTCWTENVMAK
ncbi:hypothetical protein BKA70DRAFT_1234981 [Coprinopsis sp. MPI-PUGE-AT-0042]|nr:hypothetical protein BKA70DRAFT_1234981 [Coprinopsis sp. MPI-PUGE-AT-0042]